MSFKISGTITKIFPSETKGTFTKREFVVSVQEGNYTNELLLQFTKDKCSLLDKYEVGKSVEVDFNLSSKEYNGKYYTNANAWKIS